MSPRSITSLGPGFMIVSSPPFPFLWMATMVTPYLDRISDALSDKFPRADQLHDAAPLGHLEMVEDIGGYQALGDPSSHIPFREDQAICSGPLQDPTVKRRYGLGNDLLHPQLFQHQGGHDRRLHVLPQAHDGHIDFPDADGTQRILISRIHLNSLGGEALHGRQLFRIGVDTQDLAPLLRQSLGHRKTEIP